MFNVLVMDCVCLSLIFVRGRIDKLDACARNSVCASWIYIVYKLGMFRLGICLRVCGD